MSDTKLSALPAAAAGADTDTLVGLQSGAVVLQTASALKTYMHAAPGAIGGTTPAAGAFTTVSATGQITSTLANGTAPLVVASSTNVANLNASSLSGATMSAPGAIGGGTPAAAAFTTISATGAITSTLATGTAPFTIASTTNVANLNASTLSGKTYADPGPIGSGTPSTGAFTTISATGAITSTLATGTAPFTVASTTNVANLNASSLSGATMGAPGAIGGGTPAAGTFTVLTASTSAALTSPTFAAGSGTAGSWPVFTPGTTPLTSPVAGTLEVDATNAYLCTDAGNRGVLPIEHYIRQAANRTFASNTNVQALFDSVTNGTLTLETGVYWFECFVYITTMNATSGNGKFDLLGAGGASLTNVIWMGMGQDSALDTVGAISGNFSVSTQQGAAQSVTASTSTVMCYLVRGTFDVSGAGSIVPSYKQANATAMVINPGSYFRCRRMGATGAVAVGQWT